MSVATIELGQIYFGQNEWRQDVCIFEIEMKNENLSQKFRKKILQIEFLGTP